MHKEDWNVQLGLYDALVDKTQRFSRKGKSVPHTSANGYMFSFINKEGQFGIRLSKASQELFKAKYESDIFLSHGSVMKDYVLVPNSLLRNSDELLPYLEESFDFVMSLPSK